MFCFDQIDKQYSAILEKNILYERPIPERYTFEFYFGHIYAFYDLKVHNKFPDFSKKYARGIDPNLKTGVVEHWHSKLPEKAVWED